MGIPQAAAAHPVRRAVARGAFWALRIAVIAAAAVAVAPVTLVAVGAAGFAWWRGWTPRRLYEAAAWCSPMAVAWLIAVVVWPVRVIASAGSGRGRQAAPPGVGPGAVWFRVVAAPYRAWAGMWQLFSHGQVAAAVVAVARSRCRPGSRSAGLAGPTGGSGCGPGRPG